MKKKLIILGLIFFLFTAAFLVIKSLRSRSPIETPSPKRSVVVDAAPSIILVPGAPKKVLFSLIQNGNFSLPKSLPLYGVTPSASLTIINNFASALSAPSPKTVITKNGNKNMFWNSDNFSLSYTQTPSLSTMSFRHKNTGLPTIHPTKEGAATTFLSNLLGPSAATQYFLRSQVGETPEGGTKTSEPNSNTVFVFEYRVDNIPVLLTNFDPVSATVTVGNNNAILSATIIFPPATLSQQPGQTETASVETILDGLNANLGLLVSSLDSLGNEYGAVPVFLSVKISKIIPVYYFEKNLSVLRPAYLIDGLGEGQTKTQEVQYFLYASDQ